MDFYFLLGLFLLLNFYLCCPVVMRAYMNLVMLVVWQWLCEYVGTWNYGLGLDSLMSSGCTVWGRVIAWAKPSTWCARTKAVCVVIVLCPCALILSIKNQLLLLLYAFNSILNDGYHLLLKFDLTGSLNPELQSLCMKQPSGPWACKRPISPSKLKPPWKNWFSFNTTDVSIIFRNVDVRHRKHLVYALWLQGHILNSKRLCQEWWRFKFLLKGDQDFIVRRKNLRVNNFLNYTFDNARYINKVIKVASWFNTLVQMWNQ